MTIRKPAKSAIADILNKRSEKTHPRDLGNVEGGMIRAANDVPLKADGTLTLLNLIDDYRTRMDNIIGFTSELRELERKCDALLESRNKLRDIIVMDTNPLLNGTLEIERSKNDLVYSLRKHPLNPGKNEGEKEKIACNWTNTIATAMIDSLTPELQAGLSQSPSLKR